MSELRRERWRRGVLLAGLLAAGLGVAPSAWARYRPANWSSIPDVPSRGSGEYYVSLTQSEYKVPDNATITIEEQANQGSSTPQVEGAAPTGALHIDNEWVTIWMGQNSTLTLKGVNSPHYYYKITSIIGTKYAIPCVTGGGAGIYLPSGKNLILRYAADSGTATVKAIGGDGYGASNGSNGDTGGSSLGGHDGGSGGSGAGSGGAGIGTPGVGGGSGGSGHDDDDNGNAGYAGSSASAAGTLWVYDGIKVVATAGATGGQGSAGSGGDVSGSHLGGGGGGGGGGGKAGAAADIGGAGGGGGGGGNGGKGHGHGGGGGGGGAISGPGGTGGTGGSGYVNGGSGGTPDSYQGGAGGSGKGGKYSNGGDGGSGGNQGAGGAAGIVCYVDKTNFTLGGSGTGYGDGKQSTFADGAVTLDHATDGPIKVVLTNSPDDYALKYGSSLLNMPVEPPKCNGVTFLGYYTGRYTGTKIFNADGTVSTTEIGGATTLYAHWSDEGSTEQQQAQFVVNTTDDPANSRITFYDGVVSLREAIWYSQIYPTYKNAQGTRAITFADRIFSSGAATIQLYRRIDDNKAESKVEVVVQGPTDKALTISRLDCGFPCLRIGANTSLTLERLTFNSTFTSDYCCDGGAIDSDTSNFTCRDCKFTMSGDDGGAIYCEYSTGSVVRCTFSSCNAQSGGAIYAYHGNVLQVSNTLFEACASVGHGGGIRQSESTVVCSGCRFSKCKTTNSSGSADGGGVYGGSGEMTFVDTTFDSCTAAIDGGAIGVANCDFRMVNCSVVNNSASGCGGGLLAFAVGSSTTNSSYICNTTFRGNSCGGSEGYGGAGIYCTSSSFLRLLNVLAVGNSLKSGTLEDFDQYTNSAVEVKAYSSTFSACSHWSPTVSVDVTTNATEAKTFLRSADATDRYAETTIDGVTRLGDRIIASGSAGKGCTVYHSDDWANVAFLGRSTSSKTALVGDAAKATTLLTSDITGPIDLSYGVVPAVGCKWACDTIGLTVTTLDDTLDPTDGEVSLREAVGYAADYPSLAQDDVFPITFSSEILASANVITCTWARTQIELTNLAHAVVIKNPESKTIVLDGNNKFRHFRIFPGNRLDLEGVKLINGFGASYGKPLPGTDGGSILNYGALNALDCHFAGNRAGGNYKPAYGIEELSGSGGAVFTGAKAESLLHRCTFYGNHAANGGAIAGEGTQTVASVTFSENRAGVGTAGGSEGKGGGAYVTGGDAVFVHCTFVGNDAGDGGAGGAVYVETGSSDTVTPAHIGSSIAVGNWAGSKASDIHAFGSGAVDLGCVACGVTNGTATTWFYADSSYFGVAPSQLFPDATATGATPKRLNYGVGHVYYPVYETSRDMGVRIGTKTEGQYDGVYFEYQSGVWKPLRGRSGRFLPTTFYTDKIDQLNNNFCEKFLGAVMEVGEIGGDPVPSVPVDTYVVSQATWTAFADAVSRLVSSGPKAENKITFAGPASNATITAGAELTLVAFTNVPLVVLGPVTFAGSGGRFFTLEADNDAIFRDIQFANGGGSSLDIGGAIWGMGGNHLTTSNCVFSSNRAQWGGAIGMDGQSVLDFQQTGFDGNAAASDEQGNDVYQEKGTSAITGGSFNPSGFVVWQTGSPALMTSAYAAKSWYTVSGSGDAAVAALNAEATPEASELTVSSGTVSLTPGNVKPFLWYALERADSPVGPYVTVESSWVQADADGNLPAALTAPTSGDSGFYRVTTSATR